MARDKEKLELELPEPLVFKNLDFRKTKLQDEIQKLEAELATDAEPSDAVNDAAKAAKARTCKQAA